MPRGAARNERALSLSRLARSFGYALAGVRRTWSGEANFRLEVALAGAALLLAAALEVSPLPVLLASAVVLALELFNSALEAAVDLVSLDKHPLAERAKDAGAGAVLVASAFALLVGLVHLGPPLWARLGAWL